MLADDFSFPVVHTPVPHHFSVDSPSFWYVSPQRDDSTAHGRRSGECSSAREGEEMKGVLEEKMDMLWEDFNEELQRVCSRKGAAEDDGSWESGGAGPAVVGVGVCCVQTLEMSQTSRGGGGGGVVSQKRQSVVVVLKVLKKMFLLHNSARFMRRRKPDRCYLNR